MIASGNVPSRGGKWWLRRGEYILTAESARKLQDKLDELNESLDKDGEDEV